MSRLRAGRARRRSLDEATATRLFIIRNGKINPEWEAVEAGIFSISLRSISTLIKNQGIGDLYRIYAKAQIEGIDFNSPSIPSWFGVKTRGIVRTGIYAGTL